MKRKLITIFTFLCSCGCLIILQSKIFTLQNQLILEIPSFNNLPSIEEASWLEEKIYFIKEIEEQIKGMSQIRRYSLWGEETIKRKGQEVNVNYVGPSSFELSNLNKLSGRFFVESDIKNQERYAVLDKKMAIKEFATIECVGEEIQINEEQYVVIGVIEYAGLLDKLVYNRSQIYLPAKVEKVNQVWIECNHQDTLWVEDILRNTILDIRIYNMELNTYKVLNEIRISYIIVLYLVLIKTIINFKQDLKEKIKEWRKSCEQYYMKQVLKQQIRTWKKVVAYLGLIIMLVIVIFNIKLDIDPNYIPRTLAYKSEIKETIYEINNKEMIKEELSHPNRQILHNINQIVDFIMVIFWINILILINKNTKKEIK